MTDNITGEQVNYTYPFDPYHYCKPCAKTKEQEYEAGHYCPANALRPAEKPLYF